MIRSTFRRALLTGAAATLWASHAHSQTAPATSQPAPAKPASTTVETIVVTATRRAESIQRVPGQVTALSAADLSQVNANSFADFAALVPGLSYAYETPGNNLIVIRGVTTGSQLSSAIGLYLDDVPLGASTSFGLGYENFSVNLYDLSRVEVLNGPQGTLYGASSLGGAVKYITTPPDPQKFSAMEDSEVSLTDHGGTNSAFRGSVNVPLPDGLGALRVDGIDQYDSGFVKDPIYHRTDQGSARTLGGRVSVLLKPTDSVDVRLTAYNQTIPGEGADAVFRNFANHAPTYGTYDQAFPTAQPSVSAVSLYEGTVNWTTPYAKLTSITAYQTNDGRSNTDESLVYDAALGLFGGGNDAWQLHVDDHTRKFTQEVRVSSPDTGWFTWIVGGFLDHQQTSEIVNLLDASNPGGLFLGLPPFISNLPSTYLETAGYADATVKFTPQLDLGLGIRYSHQHQTYDESVYGLLATGSDFVLHPPLATSDQSVVTYLVNPRYQITPDSMVYARIASGFRPGGPNFVLAPGLGNPTFQPDKLWNYEIGEKSTFLDHRALLNVDVYDIQWSNIQVTVNNGGVNQLENAGDARVQGAEAAFSYRICPPITLGGSASLSDAHLTTAAPVLDLQDTHARLPLSPKFSFALNANYDFDITDTYTGRFTINDRYQGDRTIGFATPVSPRYTLGSYNLLDLDLALYAPNNIELDLFAKNLLDKAGEVSAVTIANEYNPAAPVPVTLTQPRTIGLGLKLRFN